MGTDQPTAAPPRPKSRLEAVPRPSSSYKPNMRAALITTDTSNQDPDHTRTSRSQLVVIGAVFAGQTTSEPCTTSRPRISWRRTRRRSRASSGSTERVPDLGEIPAGTLHGDHSSSKGKYPRTRISSRRSPASVQLVRNTSGPEPGQAGPIRHHRLLPTTHAAPLSDAPLIRRGAEEAGGLQPQSVQVQVQGAGCRVQVERKAPGPRRRAPEGPSPRPHRVDARVGQKVLGHRLTVALAERGQVLKARRYRGQGRTDAAGMARRSPVIIFREWPSQVVARGPVEHERPQPPGRRGVQACAPTARVRLTTCHRVVWPPSTTNTPPVVKEASGDAR